MKKLIGMFRDVPFGLFKKPATEKYPFVKKSAPERYHGLLTYQAAKCTGCMLCVKDCPASTIKIHILDRKTKQFAMSYNLGRCVYCKQCVFACNFGALQMTNEKWEIAATTKDGYDVYYGKQEYIDAILAKRSEAKDQAPEVE